jgi:hypothetical protein
LLRPAVNAARKALYAAAWKNFCWTQAGMPLEIPISDRSKRLIAVNRTGLRPIRIGLKNPLVELSPLALRHSFALEQPHPGRTKKFCYVGGLVAAEGRNPRRTKKVALPSQCELSVG